MARRKSKMKRSRSRTPKTLNASAILESALIANAVTQGFFGTDIGTFFTSPDGGTSAVSTGRNAITAREIFSGLTGGSYGTSYTTQHLLGSATYTMTAGGSFGDAVKANLSDNGGKMVASLIIIPASFRIFNKLTSKPRSMANQALKMTGLPVRV